MKMQDVMTQLKELETLFNKIKVTTSKREVVNEDGKNVIKSDTKTEYKDEDINALFEKVIELRNDIVS